MASKKFLTRLNIASMVATIVGVTCAVVVFPFDIKTKISSELGGSISKDAMPITQVNRDDSELGGQAFAQNGNCNLSGANVNGTVILNCPNNSPGSGNINPQNRALAPPLGNPTAPGGRYRKGVFIPNCQPGYSYSLEQNRCMLSQYVGGVILCGPDDVTFIPGRGSVPNCQ